MSSMVSSTFYFLPRGRLRRQDRNLPHSMMPMNHHLWAAILHYQLTADRIASTNLDNTLLATRQNTRKNHCLPSDQVASPATYVSP